MSFAEGIFDMPTLKLLLLLGTVTLSYFLIKWQLKNNMREKYTVC